MNTETSVSLVLNYSMHYNTALRFADLPLALTHMHAAVAELVLLCLLLFTTAILNACILGVFRLI